MTTQPNIVKPRYRITIVHEWTTRTEKYTSWVHRFWSTSFIGDPKVRLRGQEKGVVISYEL